MNAYIFQASLLCAACGEEVKQSQDSGGAITFADMREDSEHYPQGPYPDGGGEADYPCHCDRCETFLENPLTGDGVDYVLDQLGAFDATHRGNAEVLNLWREFYAEELACRAEELYPREHM